MYKNNIKRRDYIAVFGFGFLALSNVSHATENGSPTTTFGVYDFAAGITPPPTANGTIAVRTGYYSVNTLRDKDGNRSDNDFSLKLFSISAVYLRMTESTFLGANYGFGGVLPFFKMDAELDIPTPVGTQTLKADPFRMSDIVVIPLILQWNVSRNLFINTSFAITTPHRGL